MYLYVPVVVGVEGGNVFVFKNYIWQLTTTLHVFKTRGGWGDVFGARPYRTRIHRTDIKKGPMALNNTNNLYLHQKKKKR